MKLGKEAHEAPLTIRLMPRWEDLDLTLLPPLFRMRNLPLSEASNMSRPILSAFSIGRGMPTIPRQKKNNMW
jgi:hypothetical protein